MLIDTHAHLTAAKFDEDRAEVIARARAAGVGHMVTIGPGFGITGNRMAIALAEAESDISATVGVHPCEAAELWQDNMPEQLVEMAQSEQVVGIGECGLDYAFGRETSRDVQLQAFGAQCALAVELNLPVIVHTRDAFEDTLAVLREHEIGTRVPGVIHFFTTTREQAEAYLELGLMLSIPGVVTLPNAPDLVEAVPHLPLDRVMVETDAPYAAPVPKRGRRNEPAYVGHVADKIAELQKVNQTEVRQITTQNAIAFFKLPIAAGEVS